MASFYKDPAAYRAYLDQASRSGSAAGDALRAAAQYSQEAAKQGGFLSALSSGLAEMEKRNQAAEDRQYLLDERELARQDRLDKANKEYATQEAVRALLAPKQYAARQLEQEQVGIENSIKNLEGQGVANAREMILGELKASGYDPAKRSPEILREAVMRPEVDMLEVQKVIPKTEAVKDAAKVAEYKHLASIYGDAKAADMMYGKKSSGNSSSDKRQVVQDKLYQDVTKAIGKLDESQQKEILTLADEAKQLGVMDEFAAAFGASGGYSPKEAALLNPFDWGVKNVDLDAMEAIVARAKDRRGTVTQAPTRKPESVKTPTREDVLTTPKDVRRYQTLTTGQVKNIKDTIAGMRDPMFGSPKIESYIKAQIDKEYGQGTYDKYK